MLFVPVSVCCVVLHQVAQLALLIFIYMENNVFRNVLMEHTKPLIEPAPLVHRTVKFVYQIASA